MLRKDESVWIRKTSSSFMLYIWRNLVALWGGNFRAMLFLISNAGRNLKMQISPTYSKWNGCIVRFLNLPARFPDHKNFSCNTEVDPYLYISCGLCIPREMYMNWGNLFSSLFKSGLVNLSKGTQSHQKSKSQWILAISLELCHHIPAWM